MVSMIAPTKSIDVARKLRSWPNGRMLPLAPIPDDEWRFAELPPERASYLMSSTMTFEEIAASIAASHRIVSAAVCRYRDPPKGVSARQIVFRIALEPPDLSDLFFNARDGLRGRYWHSPEIGDAATRYCIDSLMQGLLDYASANVTHIPVEKKASPMTVEDMAASLAAPSAKIWPYECNAEGRRDLDEGGRFLDVRRWHEANVGSAWRWTPLDRDLEIKGALIDGDRMEHVPEGKRDRAGQIYRTGIT